jgi:microcystin-dependent protein
MNTPPTGWLKANGATVSRTTYAQLFSVLGTLYGSGDGSTTFTLPDFRGEFLRAFDDSRGVDASRAFGSAQAGDVLSHTHAISVTSGNNSVDHSHSISLNSGYQSADHSHGQGGTWGSGGRSAAHSHSQSDNLSGNITGGWGCYGGGGFTNEVMIGRGGGLQTGTESADHSHNTAIGGSTGGVSANHYHGVSGSSAGASVPHTHAISGTSAATGGTETRPRNIAVLACIKY